MRSARRSRASLATFSALSRSTQNASDPQRRANEAQAVEGPAEHESNKETFKVKHKVTLTITSLLSILGSIGGLGVLVIHMRGAGLVGGRIANSGGVFFGSGRSSRSA